MSESESLPSIDSLIYLVRGYKVILDEDLARLYGVETRILTRAVGRNMERFPEDFMFQLSIQEVANLRSQLGISSFGYGGRRYRPLVFTEQGVAMLSSVLHSPRAILANVQIMRTFVRLRQWLISNEKLASKVAEMEKHYDGQFKVVFDAIREIMNPAPPPNRRQSHLM